MRAITIAGDLGKQTSLIIRDADTDEVLTVKSMAIHIDVQSTQADIVYFDSNHVAPGNTLFASVLVEPKDPVTTGVIPRPPTRLYSVGNRVRVISKARYGAVGDVRYIDPSDGKLEIQIDGDIGPTRFDPVDVEPSQSTPAFAAGDRVEGRITGRVGTVRSVGPRGSVTVDWDGGASSSDNPADLMLNGPPAGSTGAKKVLSKIPIPVGQRVLAYPGISEWFGQTAGGPNADDEYPVVMEGTNFTYKVARKDLMYAEATSPPPVDGQVNISGQMKFTVKTCPECKGTGEYECPITGKKSPCTQGCEKL